MMKMKKKTNPSRGDGRQSVTTLRIQTETVGGHDDDDDDDDSSSRRANHGTGVPCYVGGSFAFLFSTSSSSSSSAAWTKTRKSSQTRFSSLLRLRLLRLRPHRLLLPLLLLLFVPSLLPRRIPLFCVKALSSSSSSSSSSRREWLASLVAATTCTTTGVLIVPFQPCEARAETTTLAGELPSVLKDFTKLAPLGPLKQNISMTTQSSSLAPASKTYGLSLEQLATRLYQDLALGATGRGSYIISGDLSTDIFRDDCIFVDPTNRVRSLAQYQKALTILFDTENSVVQVLTSPLQVNRKDRTISGRFRSRGYLKLPWKPYVSTYESDITYFVDDDGLVYQQAQQWTKSAVQALRESFTPSVTHTPNRI